jgi:hypothetical protein
MKLREVIPETIRRSVAWFLFSRYETLLKLLPKKARVDANWFLFKQRLGIQEEANRLFDEAYGTDTSPDSLSQGAAGNIEPTAQKKFYRPFWEFEFVSIMKTLEEQASVACSDFIFLEFGSGKGKTLLLAGDYPFKKIIGVEFAPYLHEIAVNNCRVYHGKRQRCFQIAPQLGDPLNFTLPNEPLVCFVFESLDPANNRSLLKRLEDSIEAHPRPVYLIYAGLRFLTITPEALQQGREGFGDLRLLKPLAMRRTFIIYHSGIGTADQSSIACD